jgi:carbamoyltransferase
VRILRQISFPHSLGLLYSAFTYFTGFKVNSGEYKLMGLAPYGEPRYVDVIRGELIDLKEDGSFRLNMDYFDYCGGLKMTNGRFSTLFGGPRREPETPITRREMDLARSIQEVTEEALLRMARTVHRETGQKHLVLAGGVALNCVANGRLLREGPFEDLWIQPAAGDAGSALGCALFAWHRVLGRPRQPDRRRQKATYLGPAYSDDEIGAFLESHAYPAERVPEADLADRVADLLAAGQGRGLVPGAHGIRTSGAGIPQHSRRPPAPARCSPCSTSRSSSASRSVPSRRPCFGSTRANTLSWTGKAPICSSWPTSRRIACARCRRRNARAEGFAKLKVARSEIPAVTHVDNSARIQTIDREDHPRFYDLVAAFHRKTGCPVVINTSFNVRGEPIVCTPEEAYACFMRTRMDYLVLGTYLLDKERQPVWNEEINWQEQFELD